jgi:demethoxyubiquinone hydroxylase (CLK1/Coq7/Cat5 family)
MKVIKTVSQSKQFRGIQSNKSIRQVVTTNRSATHLAKSNKSSQIHRKFSTTQGSQKKEIIDRIIRVDHAGEYGAQVSHVFIRILFSSSLEDL